MNGAMETEIICRIDMTLLSIAMTTYQVSSRGHYMHIILALTLAPYVNQLNHTPLLQVQLVCTHFLLFSLSPMPQFVGYQQFVGYLQLTNSTTQCMCFQAHILSA